VTDLEASRRTMLTGVAAAALAVPVLAACGTDDPTGSAGTPATAASDSPSAPAPTGGGSSGSAAEDAISTSEIPVGGGTIFADEKIVVTQPTSGEFKAFSAVCPHQGCILAKVEDGTIDCSACHGSKFSIEDGSVEQGPATKGLTAKSVSVTGASLTVS
jgi:nitrite reductase/ring-hydroxylating ferredoxin subunit